MQTLWFHSKLAAACRPLWLLRVTATDLALDKEETIIALNGTVNGNGNTVIAVQFDTGNSIELASSELNFGDYELFQSGTNNDLDLDVSGDNHLVRTTQTGVDGLATLTQTGSNHTATLLQTNVANTANISQAGFGNTATVTQGL